MNDVRVAPRGAHARGEVPATTITASTMLLIRKFEA